MKFLLFALLTPYLWGGQSLHLTSSPAVDGQVNLPNTATYSAIGSFTLEAQLDIDTLPASTAGLWQVETVGELRLQSDGRLQFVGPGSEQAQVQIGSSRSIRIRAQRRLTDNTVVLEVWDQQTGTRSVTSVAIVNTSTLDARNRALCVGSLYYATLPDVKVGFMRWSTGVVALNTAPPLLTGFTTPDLIDYEFEGNLNDGSGNGVTYVITVGVAVYVPTPTWNPQANASISATSVRTGTTVTLDASLSFSNREPSTITCVWQLTSGLSSGLWANQNTCVATFRPALRGQYNFIVTVTDTTGATDTVTLRLGAVATDDRDVVVTNNASVDAVLGSMTRLNSSPWAFFDQAQLAWGDMLGGKQDSDNDQWTDSWNNALAGTITVTNGSQVITGVGTNFQVDFCGGGSSGNSSSIIIWYPIDDATWSWGPGGSAPTPPAGTGRKALEVVSCASATQLTVGNSTGRAWDLTPTRSGLSYAKMSSTALSRWTGGSDNINYYDNVMAFYSLCYRSGITDHCDYGEWLADNWWTMPLVDLGLSADLNHGHYKSQPRIRSASGMYLDALIHNKSYRLDRMRTWDSDMRYAVATETATPPGIRIGDVREQAYYIWVVALCANYDPDSATRTACTTLLQQAVDNQWGPQRWTTGILSGVWGFASTGDGGNSSWNDGLGTVSVTNGSTTVTGSSTTFSSLQIAGQNRLWLTTNINDTSAGDSTYYTVTYVSPTQLTLDRPYEGTTGSGKFWLLTPSWLAYGSQPYMVGIASSAWSVSRQALLTAGDTARAATVASWVTDSADWMNTSAFDTDWRALWYGVGFLVCDPPTQGAMNQQGTATVCASPDGEGAARFLAGEVMGALANSYNISPTSTRLDDADETFAAAMAKYPTDVGYDGIYAAELDSDSTAFAINAKAKDFGFWWGVGGAPRWLAERVGGPEAPVNRTQTVAFTTGGISGATKMKVSMKDPNGNETSQICAAAPCSISFDARLGQHLMKVEYLNSSDVTLAAGDWFPLTSVR